MKILLTILILFLTLSLSADDLKKCVKLVKNCRDDLVDCSQELDNNNKVLEENNESMGKLEDTETKSCIKGGLFGVGISSVLYAILFIVLLI